MAWKCNQWLSRRGLWVVRLCAGAVLLAVLIQSRCLTAPPERDEVLFLNTASWLQDREWNLEAFRTYPHLSPPLVYVLIGGARLLPDVIELPLMRLAILLAAASILWGLWQRECKQCAMAILPLLAFPYFAYSGCHLYTDVPMLAGGLWGWWAFRSGAFIRAMILWTMAVGFRRFGVLFPMAAIATSLIVSPHALKRPGPAVACLTPILALAGLFVFWGGLGPDNMLRIDLAKLNMPLPEVLTYSLVCIGAYLGPFAALWCLCGRCQFPRKGVFLALGASPLFWLYPPRPNRWFEVRGQGEDFWMLGLVDRIADLLLGPAKAFLFSILFFAGCVTLIIVLLPLVSEMKRTWASQRLRNQDNKNPVDYNGKNLVFHAGIVIGFTLLNLWTYIAWDKYLLPMMGSACALLAMSGGGRSVGA